MKSSFTIRSSLSLNDAPSCRTIRRRLFDIGLKSYRPAKKPELLKKNVADCIAFCQKYKAWTTDQWKSVMFSDETTISMFYAMLVT